MTDSAKEESAGPEAPVAQDESVEERVVHVAPLWNKEAHSAWLRFGIPFWMIATLVLLINADIGSGVVASTIFVKDGVPTAEDILLQVSVFSSVTKLWDNEIYPLAIFIAITSIAWPYLKLLLSFYAWARPYRHPRRREMQVEFLDAFDKWSFVDIVVLVEIMVAFRSSIEVTSSASLEVVVRAEWGFYGFVAATMMSLLVTHLILYLHRQRHYHSSPTAYNTKDDEGLEVAANGDLKESGQAPMPATADEGSGSKDNVCLCWIRGILLPIAFCLYIAGVVVYMYQVIDYSVVGVGQAIPSSNLDPSNPGTKFIQIMWYFLCVVMPLWCSLLFGMISLVPNVLSRLWKERLFFMGEIAFAWSCAEVLLVSTIFAVLQMPTFGDGLVDVCSSCFTVNTEILPSFAFLCTGAALNVSVNVWFYRRAHTSLYTHSPRG